jgi:hypothetical protein
MASLRTIMNDMQQMAGRGSEVKSVEAQFKTGQQVVVKRRMVQNGPVTSQLRVGTIMAFGDNGRTVVVSYPMPGGGSMRQAVSVEQVEPVSARFKRASVQFNPAFRGEFGSRRKA